MKINEVPFYTEISESKDQDVVEIVLRTYALLSALSQVNYELANYYFSEIQKMSSTTIDASLMSDLRALQARIEIGYVPQEETPTLQGINQLVEMLMTRDIGVKLFVFNNMIELLLANLVPTRSSSQLH